MTATQPLDERAFWDLVDTARAQSDGDPDAQVDLLVESLARRSASEIVAFELRRYDLACRAYRAELWGAAFIINGGCSDDGFEYFRAWLIAQGRTAYESAIRDPDSLANLNASTDAEFEDFLYAANQAYTRATGHDDLSDVVDYPDYPDLVGDNSIWSSGGDVDISKARRLYPRLTAKYLNE